MHVTPTLNDGGGGFKCLHYSPPLEGHTTATYVASPTSTSNMKHPIYSPVQNLYLTLDVSTGAPSTSRISVALVSYGFGY